METNKLIKIITHASTFFAPFLVPIAVMLLIKEQDVRQTAVQALLFHIGISICLGISWVLSFLLVGIPFLILFGIMALYYPIKGIVYAISDKSFHYPLMRSLS
ncbi:DUF4870 domain-containing protein [Brevibacillus sp. H7]|jgi:hypothetical protein|uniref:DUF4870 domain-containing protein n=1 Tax=Brevibacillus sp. H7 TaxID=3349138 RepID=UPI0038173B76